MLSTKAGGERNIVTAFTAAESRGVNEGSGTISSVAGTAQADAFAYDSVTGALKQAWSRQGYVYGFQYDLLGRPVRTDYPGGGYERTTYDAQSRRATRIDSIPGGLLAQDAFGYDARGKMTYISGMAGTNATHFHNWYSGLGNLAGTDWLNDTNAAQVTETMTGDAMGNVGQTNRWPDGAASPVAYQNTYASGMGRITHIVKVPPAIPSSDFRADTTYRYYDPAGNVTWGIQRQYGDLSNGTIGVTHHSITRNYHGADNTVRVVQVHDESGNGSSTFVRNGSYAEYRYDPLGRRIMERTRRDDDVCYNNGDNCESTLTRFVWAGDQLLWELRVPGGNEVPSGSSGLDATNVAGAMYGRVSYFHAGGIDKPLLITKVGAESVVPRETWRGQFHAGTSPTTGASRNCPIGVHTGCLLINWPGWNTSASHAWGEEGPDIRVWYGGLVDGMRDASGQMYMRNRYYDPATGQFTQTDPIGLAGGLNAYGFAAGDPVTYSDPYGLCAWGLGIDAALGRCSETDAKHAPGGGADCPPDCRISQWTGGPQRGIGHVRRRHVGPGWGDKFVDMTDEALRHILSSTVEEGELVFAEIVDGEMKLTFERRWGQIGTRGQRIARVVINDSGQLITGFPVRNALRVAGAGTAAGVWTRRAMRLGGRVAVAISGVGALIDVILSPVPLGSTDCTGVCQ